MNNTLKFSALVAALALTLLAIMLVPALRPLPVQGSASDNLFTTIPTATSVWVGKDISTLIVATSTGRSYLEIANISGATSTAQALYCNVNGKEAVLYSGLVVHASSSRLFNLDGLYRGALYCKFPVASSTVTILEV